jgi:hypothetical protein
MYFMRRSIWLLAFGCLGLAGCGSSASGPTSPSSSAASSSLGSTFTFTRSPIDTNLIEFITPLGNLNPPGHTLPTDHIYFYHHLNHQSAPQYDVYAPADGTIAALTKAIDDQIYVSASSVHMYYLDHLVLDSGFAVNQKISAGQHLGKTGTGSFGLDLGLLNFDITLPFIVPARYSGNSLHADAPLKYFADPLKSQLYALVQGTGANRDGQVNFDQAGRLVGGWFHESLAVTESANSTAWTRHLAFVRDNLDPSKICIASGGTTLPAGVYTIAGGNPDPATVTTASGSVTYQVTSTSFAGAAGPLTITMLSDTRIRVQFAGSDQIYLR